ncbi:hypothetical protein ACFLYO_10950 [Chloroflexota bacterium]
MSRWEILEVIERDGSLIAANLYRPLGEPTEELPFIQGESAEQLISAILFDGFEPVDQAVIALPNGSVQKHWMFRLQINP